MTARQVMSGITALRVGPVRGQRAARLGLLWIGVNGLSFGLGGMCLGAVTRARSQQYFEVVTSAAEAVRIQAVNTGEALALFGALVGAAQWLALRRTPVRWWWIPATALGWSLTGITVGVVSGLTFGSVSTIGPDRSPAVTAVGALAGSLLIGFLPGAFQWLSMPRHLRTGSRWPAITGLGLVLGFGCAFVLVRWGLVEVLPWLTPEDFPSAIAILLVGTVTGAVYGTVTRPGVVAMHSRTATSD